MVQLGGFEPPTSGSTDRRSNHLSYSCTGRADGANLGADLVLGKGRIPPLGSAETVPVQSKSPGKGPGFHKA
jgi:hypothetical protein